MPLLAGCGAKPVVSEGDAADLRPYVVASGDHAYDGALLRPPQFVAHLIDNQSAWETAWKAHRTDAVPDVPFDQRVGLVVEVRDTQDSPWTITLANSSFATGVYRVTLITREPCGGPTSPETSYLFATLDRHVVEATDDHLFVTRTHKVCGDA